MHKKRVLHIEVSRLSQSLGQFADVWRRAERGEKIDPCEGAGFESMASLLRTFTPKRRELIEFLKTIGPRLAA